MITIFDDIFSEAGLPEGGGAGALCARAGEAGHGGAEDRGLWAVCHAAPGGGWDDGMLWSHGWDGDDEPWLVMVMGNFLGWPERCEAQFIFFGDSGNLDGNETCGFHCSVANFA